MDIIKTLVEELSLGREQVEKTVALIDEGATIPFIARYRKEVTGSLDDEQLRRLSERLTYLRSLEDRREEVRRLIAEQEKLTPELAERIRARHGEDTHRDRGYLPAVQTEAPHQSVHCP